jgi:L-rhamnose-H+ transport protein
VVSVLKAAPPNEIVYCFLCGAMWGLGGLTWGLMIRYLGVGLGLAIGCGLASAAGTLVPPVLGGEFTQALLQTTAGLVSLGGVLVSLIGILLVGGAGMSKEHELAEEAKKTAVAEYNFKLGLCVAVFAGLMTAALNVGLQGGQTLEKLARTIEPVTSNTWKGIPVLVVVFLGGFAVNAGWCLFLNAKNRTTGDYVSSATTLTANFLFAALAGALWCSQLICVKTGASAMGTMGYLGWSVLTASTILFSSLLGVWLGEWQNTSGRTRLLLILGLAFLVCSSGISGYSGYLSH